MLIIHAIDIFFAQLFARRDSIYHAQFFSRYIRIIFNNGEAGSKCPRTFSDCLVRVIQAISIMMLLLYDLLIITFKEANITLNYVPNGASRAHNCIIFDLRRARAHTYTHTRAALTVITIFISICPEFPIISNGFIPSLANAAEFGLELNYLNHKKSVQSYIGAFVHPNLNPNMCVNYIIVFKKVHIFFTNICRYNIQLFLYFIF